MNKIQIILSLVLTAGILFSLCACSDNKDDPSERIIKYNIDGEPITLDPQIAADSGAELIILNIYEGLMRLDENDEPILGAAESYTSDNKYMSYTFTVRANAVWNDGSELTAQDFKYGIVRALAPETGSNTVDELFCIKNAQKFHSGKADESKLGIRTSGNNITFELEYSDKDFPRVLTLPPTMPCNKEFFDSTQGQYGLEDDTILSNGAFNVKKYGWSHGESISLRTNENYYGEKKPVPAGVDITIGEEPGNALKAISDGTLDCYEIAGSDIESAVNAGMTVKTYNDITWGICFNMDDSIMKNKNIRLSLLTVLNRESLEDNIPENYSRASGTIPDTAVIGGKNYRSIAGEMLLNQSDDAKRYFADGLSELELTKLQNVEILCPDDEDIQPMINYIISTWNDMTGNYCNKNPVSLSELNSAVSSGNYTIALAPLRSEGLSPYNTLKKFKTGENGNITNLKSEEYDAFLTQLKDASDADSIDAAIAAEGYLCSNAVFYPICTEARCYANASDITGLIFHQYGAEIDFRYATSLEGEQ